MIGAPMSKTRATPPVRVVRVESADPMSVSRWAGADLTFGGAGSSNWQTEVTFVPAGADAADIAECMKPLNDAASRELGRTTCVTVTQLPIDTSHYITRVLVDQTTIAQRISSSKRIVINEENASAALARDLAPLHKITPAAAPEIEAALDLRLGQASFFVMSAGLQGLDEHIDDKQWSVVNAMNQLLKVSAISDCGKPGTVNIFFRDPRHSIFRKYVFEGGIVLSGPQDLFHVLSHGVTESDTNTATIMLRGIIVGLQRQGAAHKLIVDASIAAGILAEATEVVSRTMGIPFTAAAGEQSQTAPPSRGGGKGWTLADRLMGNAGHRSTQSTRLPFVRLCFQPQTTEQASEPFEGFTMELGQIVEAGTRGSAGFRWNIGLKTAIALGTFHRIMDLKDQLLIALSIHRVGDDTHITLLETIRLVLIAGIKSNGTTEAATLRQPGDGTEWHNDLPVGLPTLVLPCSRGQNRRRFEAIGPHGLFVDLTQHPKSAVKYDMRAELLKALSSERYKHLIHDSPPPVNFREPCIVLGNGETAPLDRCLLCLPFPGGPDCTVSVQYFLKMKGEVNATLKKKTCGKRSRRGESEGAEEIDGQPCHAATEHDNDEHRQEDVVTEGEGVDNDDLQLANQFGSVMDIASHGDKRDGVANWEHSAGVMLRDTGTYTPFPVLPQPLVPWT
jgi:hypothetical protein